MDTSKPFTLYAECSVIYDGRARSELTRGNYLIIYKEDKSLLIHGADSIQPRNYQGCGTIVSFNENVITAKRKSETITINVYSIINHFNLDNWSRSQTVISGTEKHLVDKLESSINDYIDADSIKQIVREYKTPVGSIDLLVISDSGVHHVLEVKRKIANISAVSQLQRYIDHFNSCDIQCVPYLVAPSFGKSCRNQSEKRGFNLIEFAF